MNINNFKMKTKVNFLLGTSKTNRNVISKNYVILQLVAVTTHVSAVKKRAVLCARSHNKNGWFFRWLILNFNERVLR